MSLFSTFAQDTPTPVEIRIFDFELNDEISLTSDVKLESDIEVDQGILTYFNGNHSLTFDKVDYML